MVINVFIKMFKVKICTARRNNVPVRIKTVLNVCVLTHVMVGLVWAFELKTPWASVQAWLFLHTVKLIS